MPPAKTRSTCPTPQSRKLASGWAPSTWPAFCPLRPTSTTASVQTNWYPCICASCWMAGWLDGWIEAGALPLRQVVERMLHTAGRDDDREAAGRLATQLQAALGQDKDGPETTLVREDEKAALRGAAERWVEARMRARQPPGGTTEQASSSRRTGSGRRGFCPFQPLRH